jgi:hypothetical protein
MVMHYYKKKRHPAGDSWMLFNLETPSFRDEGRRAFRLVVLG